MIKFVTRNASTISKSHLILTRKIDTSSNDERKIRSSYDIKIAMNYLI